MQSTTTRRGRKYTAMVNAINKEINSGGTCGVYGLERPDRILKALLLLGTEAKAEPMHKKEELTGYLFSKK